MNLKIADCKILIRYLGKNSWATVLFFFSREFRKGFLHLIFFWIVNFWELSLNNVNCHLTWATKTWCDWNIYRNQWRTARRQTENAVGMAVISLFLFASWNDVLHARTVIQLYRASEDFLFPRRVGVHCSADGRHGQVSKLLTHLLQKWDLAFHLIKSHRFFWFSRLSERRSWCS